LIVGEVERAAPPVIEYWVLRLPEGEKVPGTPVNWPQAIEREEVASQFLTPELFVP